MTNPLEDLKNKVSNLTSAQRSIADYILKNSSEAAFLTINQLAKRVNTSTTTIMRLTSNLGYSGYSEFQKGLQQLLRDRTAPPNRLEDNLKNVGSDDLWGKTIDHHLDHIQQVRNQLSKNQLDEVVNQILSSHQIFCTSVRSGLPVGQYLTHGLNRTMGNCKLVLADTVDWVDEVISMQSGDLIIAASFPRYARRIIDFIKAAKLRDVKVVAITDSYSAPIVEYADIVLLCDSKSLAFHNSPIAAMVVVDYLINATAISQSAKTKQRLDDVNNVLTSMNYHYKETDEE